ncbi:unnamed protein product [Cladocopium goreaui]|uniref:Vms1-associating treble clef domain-containing protein n=1 Tax=Cladocopium goreaui TaxID=2562237 RepID=A0A9P1GIY6_9DINO|nr:unnamed protein product [Cladocopium goreaui]
MSDVSDVIMTLAGPVAAAEVSGPALCREWLINDQSQLRKHSKDPRSSTDLVELQSLARVRRYPLSSLSNLHLNQEDALREATELHRAHGDALVAVSTPRRFQHDVEQTADALRKVAAEAKIHIVLGIAPPEDANFEVQVATVVSQLASGIRTDADAEGGLFPGFIGEIDAADLQSLRAAVEAHRVSQAPLLLVGEISHDALQLLEGAIWRRCAFFDVPITSPMSVAELQARGAFIGFSAPAGAADISWQEYPYRRPLRTEQDFHAATDLLSLTSSGLRFRTDLTAYGGPGLGYAVDLVSAGRAEPSQLTANAVAFLSYPWVAPLAPEKVIHEIPCHWCGTKKVEGEHFSKMDALN